MAYQLREKLMSGGLGGLYLYISKKAAEATRRFTKKNLKQFNDAVVKAGIGVVLDFIPMVRESAYLSAMGDYVFADGVRDLVVVVVDKPADCWAESSTQIHCINFTQLPSASQVFIDGAAATGATISGSANDFTIVLTTALSAGEHDLVVVGGNNREAFSGKIYV